MVTATQSLSSRDQLECVKGQIAFARCVPDEKAPAVAVPGHDIPMVNHEVTIRNARPIVSDLSLDREGFTLIQHQTCCADVRDPEIMREKYLEELVPFIKSYFNASWVLPRRHGLYVRRSIGTSIPKEGWASTSGVRAPGVVAHVDLTPISGPMAAAAENQVQGIPIRPYSRLMVIQTWRALSPPPQDFPLAFCDATTASGNDLAMIEYVSNTRNEPGGTFKGYVAHFSPAQRWYYFPEMTSDELILFKAYDSETHYGLRSPHSAFDNRRAYPHANVRESVETRLFVYFD
ncbi:CmcJ/NvfI family oxidoreductase [Bradyrhizobium sp. USDA 4504]